MPLTYSRRGACVERETHLRLPTANCRAARGAQVDCENCEWSTYASWLSAGATFNRILVELHGHVHRFRGKVITAAQVISFFEQHGYTLYYVDNDGHNLDLPLS